MARSLIIGGTSGLGLELARESMARGIVPVILGRTATKLQTSLDPTDPLTKAEFIDLDLTKFGQKELEMFIGRFYPSPRSKKEPRCLDYVIWNAGKGLRQSQPVPISRVMEEIADLVGVHVGGPFVALSSLLARASGWMQRRPDLPPIHFITISSTSAWKARADEPIYCALKAAKSHFTRCVAKKLLTYDPRAKTSLVQPGGMATPNFWGPLGQDMTGYMDPAEVARIIWDRAQTQTGSFDEYSILRTDDGKPVIKDGPQLPE